MSAGNLLADRLRAVIADGLVQDGTAWCAAAGLSHGYLSSFFVRARRDPSASLTAANAAALAKVAGIRPEWLLTGEGPRELRQFDDSGLDPTIARVGREIGADHRDVRAASDARSAWGTSTLTEEGARELLEHVARARRDLERSARLAELEAATGRKPIPKIAPGVPLDDDDPFAGPTIPAINPRRRR